MSELENEILLRHYYIGFNGCLDCSFVSTCIIYGKGKKCSKEDKEMNYTKIKLSKCTKEDEDYETYFICETCSVELELQSKTCNGVICCNCFDYLNDKKTFLKRLERTFANYYVYLSFKYLYRIYQMEFSLINVERYLSVIEEIKK